MSGCHNVMVIREKKVIKLAYRMCPGSNVTSCQTLINKFRRELSLKEYSVPDVEAAGWTEGEDTQKLLHSIS